MRNNIGNVFAAGHKKRKEDCQVIFRRKRRYFNTLSIFRGRKKDNSRNYITSTRRQRTHYLAYPLGKNDTHELHVWMKMRKQRETKKKRGTTKRHGRKGEKEI